MTKKTKNENLEKHRGLFRKPIFIIALGLFFIAFGWTSKASKAEKLGKIQLINAEEEIIPITSQGIATPPPSQQKQVTDIDKKTEKVDIESDENIETNIHKLPEGKEDTIFYVVEKMPVFPGGNIALKRWISSHVKYPTETIKN